MSAAVGLVPAALLTHAGAPPRCASLPVPQPSTGEVLVRVLGAPIVPLDKLCASGTSYFGMPTLPYVPGVQGVGVIERGSDALADGTPVWFATSAGMAPGDGSMRGFAAVPEPDVVPLPAGADPALVAALGLSAVAAWMALTWCGGLTAGQHVLVLGAGGIVGQSAIQLALLAGAARVTAAARSQESRELALQLGAAAAVDLRAADDVPGLAARMATACGGPVDLVIDPLFGVPAAAALRTLRPSGRLVNFGSSAAEIAPIDSSTLRSRSLQVLGYTNNALTPAQRRDALEYIVQQVIGGRLTVQHRRVPLTDVETAWEATGGGRVVLIV